MRSTMICGLMVAVGVGCGLDTGGVGSQLTSGPGEDAGGSGGGSGGGASGGSAVSCDGDVLSIHPVDKVDLLFVIDNSGSMREEQESLRKQLPRLINILTSGVGADGTTGPRVRDLHLGVVSTDMGLPGVPGRAGLGCGDESRPRGDDGVLRNLPNPGMAAGLTCADSYPSFLAFSATSDALRDDAMATQLAADFACTASLGTTGCGFEMPLESALHALWPSDNILPDGVPGSFADNRPLMNGSPFGQGAPTGRNTGFLRNSAGEGQSLIAVVVVTDEEDCSSHNMGHLVPPAFLADGDPLKPIGLNLRCFNEGARVGGDGPRDNGEANLFATTRYAQALKALRPGQEDLVFFAGIVGVPPDLVEADRLAQTDFSNRAARDAHYDSLLADVRMREMPDPHTLAANPNLIPSCLRDAIDPATGTPVTQKAFPPRRYLKVAKELGEAGLITSICSEDFTPAVDQITARITRRLGGPCLSRTLDVTSNGTVNCDVIWELPLPGTAPGNAPTSCEQRADLLSLPANGEPKLTADGRPRCVLTQVPVIASAPNTDPSVGPTAGWYYDDFSNEITQCANGGAQRIAFTDDNNINATPPNGVTARLLCRDSLPTSCR